MSVAPPPALPDTTPCTNTSAEISWLDPAQEEHAARLCRECPAADDCLLWALRAHSEHRQHRDSIGITGVYSGIWFEPGYHPRRAGDQPYDRPDGRRSYARDLRDAMRHPAKSRPER